jgi:hypothetical protein
VTETSMSSYYSCPFTPTPIDPTGYMSSNPMLLASSSRSSMSRNAPALEESSLSSQGFDLSPTTSITGPPTSSAPQSLSQPQVSRSWSDSSRMDRSSTTALSSTVYHSLASSADDLAMEYIDLEPEPKPKSRSEPELLAFIPTTPPPSYFEDDFTMYLDKLLLAVLEDEQQHSQNQQSQHENRTRQCSYSTFSATQSPDVINAETEMLDQSCYGSQSQTPSVSDSDGIAEWTTSWTPTDEIVYATKIGFNCDLNEHSGSGFCSCSCSECTYSWTSRTQSIISESAQSQALFFSEPGISTSSSSDSTASGSSTSTACTLNKVLGSDKTGRSRTYSISAASASGSDAESQDHQGRRSISSRGITSMIYGYDEERYTSDDDEYDQGPLDTRSRSVSGAGFYSEVSSQDTTTVSDPTPMQSKPKRKRCLSLGQEEHKDKDKDQLQPEDSDAIRDTPPFKKRKLVPTHILKSIHPKFTAAQPASLRRGLSLRSIDDENAYTPEVSQTS